MARTVIDLDRGVRIGRDRDTKVYVYMYMDTPGVYLNAFGKPVSEGLAKMAGFEVEKLRRERLRRERLAEFNSELNAELDLAQDGGEDIVLASGGGYRVLRLASGMVNVVDEDGQKVNPIPLSEQLGRTLLTKLTEDFSEETSDGSASA